MRHTVKIKLTQSDIYVLQEGLEKIKSIYDDSTPPEFLFGEEYLENLIRYLGSFLDKYED